MFIYPHNCTKKLFQYTQQNYFFIIDFFLLSNFFSISSYSIFIFYYFVILNYEFMRHTLHFPYKKKLFVKLIKLFESFHILSFFHFFSLVALKKIRIYFYAFYHFYLHASSAKTIIFIPLNIEEGILII